jgi:hypothetical protein
MIPETNIEKLIEYWFYGAKTELETAQDIFLQAHRNAARKIPRNERFFFSKNNHRIYKNTI